MLFKRSSYIPFATLLSATLLALAGCGGNTSGPSHTDGANGIQVPEKIRQSLAIDLSQVTGIATIGETNYPMQRVGDQYQVSIPNIPVNTQPTINLTFTERLPDGTNLILATAAVRPTVRQTDRTVRVFESDFDYSHDRDQDNISNIEERELGTNPLVPENSTNRNVIVQFTIPQRINEPQITRVIAIVAGTPTVFSRRNDLITVTGVVPSSITVKVEILLQQVYEGEDGIDGDVPIARAVTESAAGEEDLVVALTDTNFSFNFDSDSDGVLNIDEMHAGTDPFN